MTDIISLSHRHAQAGPGVPVKVLLVEDSSAYAELVCDMLEESAPALSVTTCAGIAEAQTALGNEQFDCVIMDLGLPDARGLTGMRRLVSCAPDIPVVVLTGRDDDARARSSSRVAVAAGPSLDTAAARGPSLDTAAATVALQEQAVMALAAELRASAATRNRTAA